MNKQYSSFSQTKGLLWKEWFDRILDNDFLPPVGATIDLTNNCNLKCYWCNSSFFRENERLDTNHVKKVTDMIAKWGVKSLCFAGGGEPSLHPDFAELIEYGYKKGLEMGISTNGILMDDRLIDAFAKKTRFCGVSIDAGNKETWIKIKGGTSASWDRLMKNLKKLCSKARKTDLDLSFKFMIVERNQQEILEACKLAKKLGFKNFFVRPAAIEKVPLVSNAIYYESFDTHEILEQIEKCKKLEYNKFKVYASFGRVSPSLQRVIRFKKCRATPIIAQFCADGYCYPCIDYRGKKEFRMCKHLGLKKFWNSKAHKALIKRIDLRECPRCAFGHYNEQLEAYKRDYMFWKFP